jgi:broad specificity phosphatase PhoE
LRNGANTAGDPRSAGTLVCTHNVVLRCLVGEALGIPQADWHRLVVPHLAPITVIQTRDYGWFVDLEESVEQRMFARFLHPCQESQ